jgi:hypothetical protein
VGMPLLQSGVVRSTHASCVRSRRPCVSIGIRRVIDASCIRDILGQGTGNIMSIHEERRFKPSVGMTSAPRRTCGGRLSAIQLGRPIGRSSRARLVGIAESGTRPMQAVGLSGDGLWFRTKRFPYTLKRKKITSPSLTT